MSTTFLVPLPGNTRPGSDVKNVNNSVDGGEWSNKGLPEGTPRTHLRIGKARCYPQSYLMRPSPCWTHRRHGLPQVAIRSQLSCHVALGFSRHVVTVSVITFSYDIETGRSWMRWKGDDDAVVLDLVPAPEGPWIILCDHGKVLRHLFGPTWPCIVSGLKPKLWAPNPWPSPTLGRVLDYKHSRRRCYTIGFCLEFSFPSRN